MRNHIVIVSEESVYAGYYKCGIGEVVDTLADALRKYYDVTVITPGNRKGGSIGKRLTLGVYNERFYTVAAELVNEIQPNLVHNFGRPDFIDKLTVECPTVLSFDRWEDDVADYLDFVPKYDHVTTLSSGYAAEMIAAHPEAAEWPLKGIINGICSGLYMPGGMFNSNKSKSELRKLVYERLGREDTGKPLIITTGRLGDVKGTGDLIAAIPAIAEAGVDLIVAGLGDVEYEEQLLDLHEAGKVVYFHRMGHYCEICTSISAADFYLTPSRHEVCGLQPMKAAMMGSVPIVRPVGGMGENFNDTNAVLITDTIAEAVTRAIAIPPEEYAILRDNCLAGEWSWKTRVLPWVELYGLETAPATESNFRIFPKTTSTTQTATRSRSVTPTTSTTTKKASPFAVKGE